MITIFSAADGVWELFSYRSSIEKCFLSRFVSQNEVGKISATF